MNIEYWERCTFFHGYARYAQWGKHEHVFVGCIDYEYHDEIKEWVDNLDTSDTFAFHSSHEIDKLVKNGSVYMGTGTDPLEALAKCMKSIKDNYEKNIE